MSVVMYRFSTLRPPLDAGSRLEMHQCVCFYWFEVVARFIRTVRFELVVFVAKICSSYSLRERGVVNLQFARHCHWEISIYVFTEQCERDEYRVRFIDRTVPDSPSARLRYSHIFGIPGDYVLSFYSMLEEPDMLLTPMHVFMAWGPFV